MKSVLQSFLLLLATTTDRELARQIQFLKAENQILRSKLPKRITVTPQERQRLVKLGKAVGSAIRHLISIVSPRTFARWLSGETKARSGKATKAGRPRTAEEIRELVLKPARENAWGYTRILGELKKLGVRKIARSTVIKILKENGLDPGPKRGEGTWDDFLKRHASTRGMLPRSGPAISSARKSGRWAVWWTCSYVSCAMITVTALLTQSARHWEEVLKPTNLLGIERRQGTQPVGEAAVDDEMPGPRAARLAKQGEGYTA